MIGKGRSKANFSIFTFPEIEGRKECCEIIFYFSCFVFHLVKLSDRVSSENEFKSIYLEEKYFYNSTWNNLNLFYYSFIK